MRAYSNSHSNIALNALVAYVANCGIGVVVRERLQGAIGSATLCLIWGCMAIRTRDIAAVLSLPYLQGRLV